MTRRARLPDTHLDRSSFVPLYHQLQELLARQIDAGRWSPGDLMPSEPELSDHFAVSRMVVRQALAILEDDGRISRQRGRGTFIAEPQADHRAGGLIRLLQAPSHKGLTIHVLDDSLQDVDEKLRQRLGVTARVRRITTRLSLAGTPIAVSYSYLDPERTTWLETFSAGEAIHARYDTDEPGVRLGRSELSIGIGECSEVEANQLGLSARTPVFAVEIAEFAEGDKTDNPLEIARAKFRGEPLRCRLELPPKPVPAIEATFDFDSVVANG